MVDAEQGKMMYKYIILGVMLFSLSGCAGTSRVLIEGENVDISLPLYGIKANAAVIHLEVEAGANVDITEMAK